jgi:hypothetical protein
MIVTRSGANPQPNNKFSIQLAIKITGSLKNAIVDSSQNKSLDGIAHTGERPNAYILTSLNIR